MNNSKTPKIVIGVSLVALYAIGFTVFALRGKHDNVVAQGAPSGVSAPMAADPALAPLGLPESAEASAATSPQDAVSVPVAPEAADVTQAARPAIVSQPRQRAEVPVQSLPSPRPPPAADPEELSRNNSGSSAVSELPAAQSAADESVTSAEETVPEQDGQSTETPAVDNGEPQ